MRQWETPICAVRALCVVLDMVPDLVIGAGSPVCACRHRRLLGAIGSTAEGKLCSSQIVKRRSKTPHRTPPRWQPGCDHSQGAIVGPVDSSKIDDWGTLMLRIGSLRLRSSMVKVNSSGPLGRRTDRKFADRLLRPLTIAPLRRNAEGTERRPALYQSGPRSRPQTSLRSSSADVETA